MPKNFFGFHTIKALTALIGADWGCQTYHQACHKNSNARVRLGHVAIVAGVQAFSTLTAPASWRRRLTFVAINAITHFIADSVPMPKLLDQLIHSAVAILTAPLLAPNHKGAK